MSSAAVVDDHRPRFDAYTSRLPRGYYVQSQYHHISDASAGTDCRTFSDAASCDSSPSPGYGAVCTCCSVESSNAPAADIAGGFTPPRHLQGNRHHQHHHHHQQQQPPPTSFAIHQLLGLGAGDFRRVDACSSYDRSQLTLQETMNGRHHMHAAPPTTLCRCTADCSAVQSFNPADVHASLQSSPSCLDPHRGGSDQLDLSYCSDRPMTASVAAYCRLQQHDSTAPADATTWPYLRELPAPWSNHELQLPRKTVHHHHLQQQQQEAPAQHHYNELQAYCAARLQQPRACVDVTSYNNVIRQCRINYLPSNLGT